MSDEERARRIGTNEALFRQVNEEVESLQHGMRDVSDDLMHIVCECGELSCVERLAVPNATYARVRSDPMRFFVTPGHEIPDVEDVVEQGDGFYVVAKHAGVPERVARATDPRA
jgi:hypothetical protein